MRCLLFLAALALMSAAGVQAAPLRLPNSAEARAVCGFVAARGTAIQAALVKDGTLDANNDGVPDAVTVGMRDGTMRGEDLQFRKRGVAKDTAPVEVTPKDFQPGDYLPFGARWLVHGGRVYTLYFESENLRHPSYLGAIDPANAEHLVCDFASVERETLRPAGGRDADGVCGAVARKNVSYAPVAEASDDDPDLEIGRRETRGTGRITVDFANTGAAAALALLAYESGAGRGCDISYFDLLANGKIAASGDAHVALMKLQDIAPDAERTESRCDGGVPRWFAYRDRTYLDMASKPDALGVVPFHEVRVLRGTKPETVCKADFAVRWTVKSMGPEFQ